MKGSELSTGRVWRRNNMISGSSSKLDCEIKQLVRIVINCRVGGTEDTFAVGTQSPYDANAMGSRVIGSIS